ncbi:MAG: EF-P lysine aminoacylase EpmA [Gammaproteobacteria bacterium]|nr:EF-P lysine aminoacylase EpmA [Gammaproteobacteria bacterium]
MAHDQRPSVTVERLRYRARLIAQMRDYFDASGACEVTTPVLSRFATSEPALDSLALECTPVPGRRYLRTSPESAMKRLLAAGSGDIYQIGPVFRGGEAGRFHLPEFTMLEWYRRSFDHRQLMDDVEALLHSLGLNRPINRVSYAELWARHIGGDPHTITTARLADIANGKSTRLSPEDREDRSLLFDCIYVHRLEPALAVDGAVFLFDYPLELRAYARVSARGPRIAERFELIVDGTEIANGYHEITDVEEQRRCFEQDNALRMRRGRPKMNVDEDWLAALADGLPACAGVALGIERLIMVLTGVGDIADATGIGVLSDSVPERKSDG